MPPPAPGEGPSAQPEIHDTNVDVRSTVGQELQRIAKTTDEMRAGGEGRTKEMNNNANWGPFQQAERLYQQAFTQEFVGNDPAPRHFARPNESQNAQDPNGPTKLAFERLNKALQTNTALQARVRTWKESVCKRINEQWRNAQIGWTAGPGLDTNANFDAQRGTEYRDIRGDQQVIERGMQEYGQAYQKFYADRMQQRPGQPTPRPPTMVDIFNFKIDWCNKKNAEMDKRNESNRKLGLAPADGSFYAGVAWNPYVAWQPGGRTQAGGVRTQPPPGAEVQAKGEANAKGAVEALAKGRAQAEGGVTEGEAKQKQVKEQEAKTQEGQNKEQEAKKKEEQDKQAEIETRQKEDFARQAQEIRTQAATQNAEVLPNLDDLLQTPLEEQRQVLEGLLADFQARPDRMVDITLQPELMRTSYMLSFQARPGMQERMGPVLRQTGIFTVLNGAPASAATGCTWARALMAVNVFRGNESQFKEFSSRLGILRDTTQQYRKASEENAKLSNIRQAIEQQQTVINTLASEHEHVEQAMKTIGGVRTTELEAERTRVDSELLQARETFQTLTKTLDDRDHQEVVGRISETVEKTLQTATPDSPHDQLTFQVETGNPPQVHSCLIMPNRGIDILRIDFQEFHLERQVRSTDPGDPNAGDWQNIFMRHNDGVGIRNGNFLLSHAIGNSTVNMVIRPAMFAEMALTAIQGRPYIFEQGQERYRLVR